MCTIALAYQCREDAPILIAANRDEYYRRPASPPFWRLCGKMPVFSPLDLEQGGTWIGVNAAGVFAGITNRHSHHRQKNAISRGIIVHHVLAESTAIVAVEKILRMLDPLQYRPFHLLVADPTMAYLIWHDGAELHSTQLEPGFHLFTQQSLGAQPYDRDVRRFFPTDVHQASLDVFASALRQHAMPELDGTCVHLSKMGYGTRSSSIIVVHNDRTFRYLHAEGAPCTVSFFKYI